MKNILSDLNFDHWDAILLAVLPALLNLSIFIYVRIKFPNNKTSTVFSIFLLALMLWQTGDIFLRMSTTKETAMAWNSIFCASWIFVMPLGIHFCLLFTGKKKFAESLTVLCFIYVPAVVILILSLINKDTFNFISSSFWGWIPKQNGAGFLDFVSDWIAAQGVFILFFLLYHASRFQKENVKRKQTMLIAIGFSFPLIQGTATEVILPFINNNHSIPLVSTFMTSFSIAILVAMKKYRLFSITDSLKTRTILEAMTDILIVLSPDKKIQFINREGEKALGVKYMKKDSLKIEDFFAGGKSGDGDFYEKLFAPVLAGEKIANYSTELTTRSGKKIPVLISATSYKVTRWESQVLLLIHDISDQIQTEQQLAIREEEIKDKTEELNSFFYRTTHDLKGPVASIIGLTKLTKKEPNSEMVVACLDKIEVSAMRLNNILLDFIKVMHIKERTPELSLIDFPKLANGIIQSVAYSTGDDVVDFKVMVEPDIHFHCDEGFLDSILYNLVANATNYRKRQAAQQSFVHICVHNFGNGIMLKVRDNGIGIEKEIQGKIFNLFFRGTSATKGTGLGLYILKNAIAKLNGRVELESEINKGTTFTVYLPNLKPAEEIETITPVVYSSVS